MTRFFKAMALAVLAGLTGLAAPGSAQAQGNLPACGAYPRGEADYQCMCPPVAETSGAVWGSGPYTADSNICQAAAHIGAIGPGGGPVTAVEVPGQDSYEGSTSNGIQTSSWGSYGASFLFEFTPANTSPVNTGPVNTGPVNTGPVKTVPVKNASVAACAGFPDSTDVYSCSCSPQATAKGTFWGNDPYTIDSDLCIAARHSGIIDEAGGTVRALRVIGLEYYFSSENNGVASLESGPFAESVIFDRN